MYRGLVEEEPKATEEDFAFQFEAAALHHARACSTSSNKRFAGGAFAPILRRVDKFLKGRFPKASRSASERAELVRAADEALAEVVAKIKKRGINHPYVKNYVLARTTPLTRARKTLPPSSRRSRSSARTSRTSTRPRSATTRSSARPS